MGEELSPRDEAEFARIEAATKKYFKELEDFGVVGAVLLLTWNNEHGATMTSGRAIGNTHTQVGLAAKLYEKGPIHAWMEFEEDDDA